MDRLTKVEINDKTYWLNYSMAVMFDVDERYGDAQNALNAINSGTKESFGHLKWLLARMAEDGELVRRDAGYDKQEFLREEDITLRIRPYEYAELMQAVMDAVRYGYHREVKPEGGDGEVDLGLAEINEKKTKTKG